MTAIQWGRSSEGYVESKCGRYYVNPLYCGTTRPQYYEVNMSVMIDGARRSFRIAGLNDCQRDCKADAQDVADGKLWLCSSCQQWNRDAGKPCRACGKSSAVPVGRDRIDEIRDELTRLHAAKRASHFRSTDYRLQVQIDDLKQERRAILSRARSAS